MRLLALALASALGVASAAEAATITSADLSIVEGGITFGAVDDAPAPSDNTLINAGGAVISVNLLSGSAFEIVFDATASGAPNLGLSPFVALDDIRFDTPAVVTDVTLTSGTAELITFVQFDDASVDVRIADYVLIPNPVTPFFDRLQVWEFAITSQSVTTAIPAPADLVLTLAGLAGLTALRHHRA